MSVDKAITQKVNDMPLLSPSTAQLLEVVGNPEHTIQDVVQIVECDSVLTANLLRRVNSASVGLVTEINTVARAVSYLGDRMVQSIAIDSCAPDLFSTALCGYEGGRKDLWEHSLKAALAARQIAVDGEADTNPDLAFTAGLLHDIGKYILSEFLDGTVSDIVDKLDSRVLRDYLTGERDVLGTDHCVIGAEVAKHWKLPDTLQQCIMHHHDPGNGEEAHQTLIYTVHLGDFLSMMGGSGTGADNLGYRLDPGYSQYVNITQNGLEMVLLKVLAEFDKTKSLLFGEDSSL